jgi:hypothetical protein
MPGKGRVRLILVLPGTVNFQTKIFDTVSYIVKS